MSQHVKYSADFKRNYVAVFAMALAGGLKPAAGAYLANLAASVVVAKLGTYAVSKEELLDVLNTVRE